MKTLLKLELLPLSDESKADFILQMSGICFAPNKVTKTKFLELLKDRTTPFAVTSDIFNLISFSDPFWSAADYRNKLRIILSVKEFVAVLKQAHELSSMGWQIDLFYQWEIETDDVLKVELHLETHKHARIIHLESQQTGSSEMLQRIGKQSASQCYICFLPKSHAEDGLLDPDEVMILMEAGSENNLLVLFRAETNPTNDELFYLEPSHETYLNWLQKKKGVKHFLTRSAYLKKIKQAPILFLVAYYGMLFTYKLIKEPAMVPLLHKVKLMFCKIWWFTAYQFRKRILRRNPKG